MNQTHLREIVKLESAFAFIDKQIQETKQKQVKNQVRYLEVSRRLLPTIVAASLTTATVLPAPVIKADQELVPTTLPEPTSIRLDKSLPSLLVIETPKPEIKPGLSKAQEQYLAEVKAKNTSSNPVVINSASAKVVTIGTDEAHRLAQEAAGKAGIPEHWKELAAIWQVESGKTLQGCVRGGGAVGPLQFLPSTFRTYAAGSDGNGDGKVDICNANDALIAAAKLLKNGGIAEGNVDGAIHNYNHSMAYVRKVKSIANSIE